MSHQSDPTPRGIPVAGLGSAENLKRLDQMGRECDFRFGVIDELRRAFAGVPDAEIERETDRILLPEAGVADDLVPPGSPQ